VVNGGVPIWDLSSPASPNTNQANSKKETRRRDDSDAVEFVRARLGFEPDAKQMEVLRSTSMRGILNCSRQWGKSTVAAAKVVHRAFTRPESLVLVASPSRRQSAELVRKVAWMLRRLEIRRRSDGDNGNSLMLPNGSRIVGLPGVEGTVRGFSAASMLVIDEAARVDDAIYKSLRPTMAVGGADLWLLSTPCGKRGFFWENWEHGGPRWHRFRAPATECPRIPADFLEEERREMGTQWFEQEYMCGFVDAGPGVFSRDLVDSAVDGDVTRLDLSMTWE
jgi:Terminase large subunit, T4likevirus-type, N-terminal